MKKRAIVIALSLALLLSVFVPGTLATSSTETEADTTTVVSQPDTEVLAEDGEGTRSGDEQTDLTDGETVTGDGQTTDEDSVTGDGQTAGEGTVTGDGQTTEEGTVTGDGQTTEEGTVTGDGQTVDEGNVTGDGQPADPTETTAATDPTETTAATDPTETTVPETTVPETTVPETSAPETIVPIAHWEGCADGCEKEDCDCLCHVYDRIMACTTLEEIYAILDSYTDEELETLAMALTEEQNAEIEARITALEPEPLPPVVLEESTDEPVESEIIYVTVNYANVAPFGEPVSG